MPVAVGLVLGCEDGAAETDGLIEGWLDGLPVYVGSLDGCCVGAPEGCLDGILLGEGVGGQISESSSALLHS